MNESISYLGASVVVALFCATFVPLAFGLPQRWTGGGEEPQRKE